jgi:NitT/TauT family transport system substrate-binding protein
MISRRELMRGTTIAAAADLLGLRPERAQAEPPPQPLRIRLSQIDAICVAPQHVVLDLLPGERFREIQYVQVPGANPYPAFASGDIDISMAFVAPFLSQVDAGTLISVLGGVHVGTS